MRRVERRVLEHAGPVLDQLDAAVNGAAVDHLEGDVWVAVVDAFCSRGAGDHRERARTNDGSASWAAVVLGRRVLDSIPGARGAISSVTLAAMIEVRRAEDAELCGFIDAHAGVWRALTVFGGVLGGHPSEDDARRHVLDAALASLAERWSLIDGTSGDEQVVCIQEVSPDQVTVALGYYSLPGVPSLTITRDDIAGGRWRLRHR